MPLRRYSNHATIDARGSHRLQLLAVPPHRRTLGVLRVWHGQDRRRSGSRRGVHLGRPNAAHHSLGTATADAGARHGVNLGDFDAELIASVRVRRFDGANTWKFIDE